MSFLVIDDVRYPVASLGTSGDGVLQQIHDWMLLRIGGALALQHTTSSATPSRWTNELAAAQQTSSGSVAIPATTPPSRAIVELRRRSGLTSGNNSHACLASPHAAFISGHPANPSMPRMKSDSAGCWPSSVRSIKARRARRGRP
jgi:hypothetical protein